MGKVRNVAPGNPANAANMVMVGNMPTVAEPVDLGYLQENVVEAISQVEPGSIELTEGSPDLSGHATVTVENKDAQKDAQKANQQGQEQPPANQPTKVDPPIVDNDDLDDPRFKGKSKKDVFEALRNLEVEKGRLANELGEARKAVDFVLSRPAPVPVKEEPLPNPKDAAELLNLQLSDPIAYAKLLKKQFREELAQEQNSETLNRVRFQNQGIVKSLDFGRWLAENVPPSLVQEADQDPVKFQFIINQFKNKHSPPEAPLPLPSNQRVVQVGAASGSGPAAKIQNPGEKQWTRAEVTNMIVNNPQEYKRREAEIGRYYAKLQAEGKTIPQR